MKFTVCVIPILLTIFLISCKEQTSSENSASENRDTIQVTKTESPSIDSVGTMEKLQGKWKEIEYPFRLAHFNNTTVKFTDEGVVEEPTFQEFRILGKCPFEVNNIKNATSGDLFLVMIKAGTCEILKVSSDTLTLSGFNVSSSSDYRIVYSRVE